MAVEGLRFEGWLYKRTIDKLAGGTVIDWNSGPVLRKIEDTMAAVNKRGALRLKRKARSIVRMRAYDSGDLMKSIKADVSKWGYKASVSFQKKARYSWVIWAGDDEEDGVDYARLVEVGRYFKDSGKRVAAVPFMRQAAADTRRWMRPRMKSALKRAIK